MAVDQGKWIKVEQKGSGPGARSSHAITIVGRKAYAFGGELAPRVPVDNSLYVLDLDTATWSVASVSGDVPPPRVGVTLAAVGHSVFMFGGRDATHTELSELYSFDTETHTWHLLSAGAGGPQHRSYHSTASDDRHVYVFGGCGVEGRLNDLWGWDVGEGKWVEYPRAGAGCPGRGGPGLVVAQGRIWVVYGFAGREVDDVHCFDPARGEWAQVETKGEKPSPRSVFCTMGMGKGRYIVVYGGEVDPSEEGHLGAGMFSGEVYVLDTETLEWRKVEDSGEDRPGARGWCAYGSGEWEGKEGLLVYGGNSPTNDRLDDIYFFIPGI